MRRITRRDFVNMSAAGGLAALGLNQAHFDRRPDESEGGKAMPFYLTRFSYTPATWAKLIQNPEDRRVAARQYIEAVGGQMHGFCDAFVENAVYNLCEHQA